MDLTAIADLRGYLTVKHSLPGRIRIKFSTAVLADSKAMAMVKSPPPLPDAVTKADLNIFSRTLLLEYDADRIDPTLLEELVNTDDDARAAAIVEQLNDALYA